MMIAYACIGKIQNQFSTQLQSRLFIQCRICINYPCPRRGAGHCGANHGCAGLRLRRPDLKEEEERADVHQVCHIRHLLDRLTRKIPITGHLQQKEVLRLLFLRDTTSDSYIWTNHITI